MSDSPENEPPAPKPPPKKAGSRPLRAGPAAMAVVMGLATLAATANELDLVQNIQLYCAACWRNAHLDPGVWDDCTQEVCCRLLTKARSGELDLARVLDGDTPERRELVRAIDMVRKRVQRSRKCQSLDVAAEVNDRSPSPIRRLELAEIIEQARTEVLSNRQDQILDLWLGGWTIPEIADHLQLPVARVSDQKYKALRKLQSALARHVELSAELRLPSLPDTPRQAV